MGPRSSRLLAELFVPLQRQLLIFKLVFKLQSIRISNLTDKALASYINVMTASQGLGVRVLRLDETF